MKGATRNLVSTANLSLLSNNYSTIQTKNSKYFYAEKRVSFGCGVDDFVAKMNTYAKERSELEYEILKLKGELRATQTPKIDSRGNSGSNIDTILEELAGFGKPQSPNPSKP